MATTLPRRGDGSRPPTGLPLPPGRMALVRDRRPLKRWRYVGVYGARVMLCAGSVRIAGIPQAFWAVWDREAAVLRERTTFGRGGVLLPDGAARVGAPGVQLDLVLEPLGEPVEVVSPHGRSFIWTRKTPVRAHGAVTLEGRRIAVDDAGLVDDSAGYHARVTAWDWSAGVGRSSAGEPVAWNLVAGVHDAPRDSERTVWVAGRPREAGVVRFAAGLDAIAFSAGDGGGELRFAAEAERARTDDLRLFASEYRQPFGTFTGTLPGGIELAEAFGVMERHAVHW
ncbi:MAG TPA: DUF2804 family protein [Solirubrobacteraceae bacterium]